MDIGITQRRRSARRPGLWHGRYRSGRLRRWTECTVRDVSREGAAIVLAPGAPAPTGRLRLELRPVGSALAPLTVSAVVRHTGPDPAGETVVGLQFPELRPGDRDDLDRMIRLFAT